MLRRFIHDTNGATAVEYGLIVGILSLAILVGIGKATGALEFLFADTESRLQQAIQ